MNVSVRRAVATALLPAASLYTRLRPPGIRILMYHRVQSRPEYDQLTVSPSLFAEHVAFLARRCRVVALGQAVSEISAGEVSEGVVVTLDDGYRDNLVHALPVLRRHGVPATIFVTPGFCDQSRRHHRYAQEPGRLHLGWEELREISRDPLVTIGSHSLTHPFLQRQAPQAALEEIAESREVIRRAIGRRVEFFCYPAGDYGARELDMVRAAGYRAAVSVAPGANRSGTPLFELRRTEVTARDEPADVAAKLRGAYDAPHALLYRRRRRRFEAAARVACALGFPHGEP